MKKRRGAYNLMRTFFGLMNARGVFRLNSSLRDQLRDETVGSGRCFRYLRSAKYVIELGEDKFEVTDLARINLLKEIVKTRKPDGKLRMVMFDVPEKLKTNRNFFRRHLAEMGFKLRQQSIWVSPYPCEDLVKITVKYHGLQKYVELAVGEIVAIS